MARITPREQAEASELEDVFERAERALGFVPNSFYVLARGAGTAPNAVTDADMAALKPHFDEDQIVQLVGVVCLFGWLIPKVIDRDPWY